MQNMKKRYVLLMGGSKAWVVAGLEDAEEEVRAHCVLSTSITIQIS